MLNLPLFRTALPDGSRCLPFSSCCCRLPFDAVPTSQGAWPRTQPVRSGLCEIRFTTLSSAWPRAQPVRSGLQPSALPGRQGSPHWFTTVVATCSVAQTSTVQQRLLVQLNWQTAGRRAGSPATLKHPIDCALRCPMKMAGCQTPAHVTTHQQLSGRTKGAALTSTAVSQSVSTHLAAPGNTKGEMRDKGLRVSQH